MSLLLEPEATTTSSDFDNLTHFYCEDCYPTITGVYLAFCGTDVTHSTEVDAEDSMDCVVCLGLDYCPICDLP